MLLGPDPLPHQLVPHCVRHSPVEVSLGGNVAVLHQGVMQVPVEGSLDRGHVFQLRKVPHGDLLLSVVGARRGSWLHRHGCTIWRFSTLTNWTEQQKASWWLALRAAEAWEMVKKEVHLQFAWAEKLYAHAHCEKFYHKHFDGIKLMAWLLAILQCGLCSWTPDTVHCSWPISDEMLVQFILKS